MAERDRADALEICSYRTVFELDRRIYRVDRLRLNPQGVPLRGVVYALALLFAAAASRGLPGIGLLERALPWYIGELAGPLLLAALAATLRIDGRPFHLAALALARLALAPRHLSALRAAPRSGRTWMPPDLAMAPDGSDPCLRRLRFTGPGALVVAVAHERTIRRRGPVGRLLRRPDVTVTAAAAGAVPQARAVVVELAARATLQTRCGR